jgi:hypothetical protein
MVSVGMIELIFGDCFFEQGCANEAAGLAAAAIASVLVGIVAGVVVRRLVNGLLGPRR